MAAVAAASPKDQCEGNKTLPKMRLVRCCDHRKFRRLTLMAEFGKRAFQFLNLRVGFTGTVPEVIVIHGLFPLSNKLFSRAAEFLPPQESGCIAPPGDAWLNFSRSCCMPRCRLTRTEP